MTHIGMERVGFNQNAHSRVYSNRGNPPLINLLDQPCLRVLDVGCGAGDNAALLSSRYPQCQIFGITHSASEAELARQHMVHCWVADIESDFPAGLLAQSFDVLIFSHVLEHLRDPATVLSRFVPLLCDNGQLLIAVPNLLSWRMRMQFLIGRFEYEAAGVLDDTHLRFFTYDTADKYLLAKTTNLMLIDKKADGSVPLWWLRRYFLSKSSCERVDSWGCRRWPNLFGGQVLIKAVKI